LSLTMKSIEGRADSRFLWQRSHEFGVRLFLDAFVKYAPVPQPYLSDAGIVEPETPEFSGFVFKIQANMNPKHRDSVAFLRICSGRFERGMDLVHAQSGKMMKLLRPYKPFANEREIIDEAFAGDVLGIPNNGDFAIGDSLCQGTPIRLRLCRAFSLSILPAAKHRFEQAEAICQGTFPIGKRRRCAGDVQHQCIQARADPWRWLVNCSLMWCRRV
jgi:peptide subunit release factor RF-3